MPSSKGVSAAGIEWSKGERPNRRQTWAKDDSIPEHNVVRTWTARDPAWRVCRETLKVADKTAAAIC